MTRAQKAPEKALAAACLRWLSFKGCFVWKQNQGALKVSNRFIRFAHVDGISDIIGMTNDGRFIAIETKTRPRKPTENQKQFLESVRLKGGIAAVVYDLDDLETKVLSQLDPEPPRSA